MATFSSEGGAFTKLTQRTVTPPDVKKEELMGKSKLAEIDDLIHLEVNSVSNINEDLIIRTLQSRFFNQKYFVSIFLKSVFYTRERIGKTFVRDQPNNPVFSVK